MGVVNQYGKWEPIEGPGWELAKTSQKQMELGWKGRAQNMAKEESREVPGIEWN